MGITALPVTRGVRLVWRNCQIFNEAHSPIWSCAGKYSQIFERLYKRDVLDVIRAGAGAGAGAGARARARAELAQAEVQTMMIGTGGNLTVQIAQRISVRPPDEQRYIGAEVVQFNVGMTSFQVIHTA